MEGAARSESRLDRYIVLKSIGKGLYSKVKLGYNLDTGENVAIKFPIISQAEHSVALQSKVYEEAQILSNLQHPNIIQVREFFQETELQRKNGVREKVSCVLVEELGSKGELFEYVLNSGAFAKNIARYFFRQLVSGLDYIHSKGYAHRDIKLEKLLISEDLTLKITAFSRAGLLVGRENTGAMSTQVGTQHYMAPEVREKQRYFGDRVDMFNAGVVLFILYCGTPPFNMASEKDPYYQFLIKKEYKSFWKLHARGKPGNEDFFCSEFMDLVEKLLAYNGKDRPTAREVLNHPWTMREQASIEEIQQDFAHRQQRAKLVKHGEPPEHQEIKRKEEKESVEPQAAYRAKKLLQFVPIADGRPYYFTRLQAELFMSQLLIMLLPGEKRLFNPQDEQMHSELDEDPDDVTVFMDSEFYKATIQSKKYQVTLLMKIERVNPVVNAIVFTLQEGELSNFLTFHQKIIAYFTQLQQSQDQPLIPPAISPQKSAKKPRKGYK